MARAALDAGADLVNDVSGFGFDPAMAPLVAGRGVPAVLMHLRGGFAEHAPRPRYHDVMGEVVAELEAAVLRAERAGVPRDTLILDPGLGFAKDAAHSLEALRRLGELAALDRPVLVGPSRKSFIGKVLDLPAGERLMGTAAAVAACVLRGAHVVRVHDVREMVQVVRVATRSGAPPRGGPPRDPRALAAFLAATEFSWLDVLDILIVAFIIYELLQFIRGTHAVQMALGGARAGDPLLGVAPRSTSRPSTGCCAPSCPSSSSASSWSSRRRSGRSWPTWARPRSCGAFRAPAGRGHRRGGARRHHPRRPAHRRHHRHRARDGPAELHRDGHRPRRRRDLRPADQHLQPGDAAPRRGGDHPGQPGGRRRLLPAPHREPRALPHPGQPPPRRHRRHRGHRRGGGRGLGGDRGRSRWSRAVASGAGSTGPASSRRCSPRSASPRPPPPRRSRPRPAEGRP